METSMCVLLHIDGTLQSKNLCEKAYYTKPPDASPRAALYSTQRCCSRKLQGCNTAIRSQSMYYANHQRCPSILTRTTIYEAYQLLQPLVVWNVHIFNHDTSYRMSPQTRIQHSIVYEIIFWQAPWIPRHICDLGEWWPIFPVNILFSQIFPAPGGRYTF